MSLRMSWPQAWGYLLSLPSDNQTRMARMLDRELLHWLPFTPMHVQLEVLASAPDSVIDSFENRRVRYSKPGGGVGYLPIVSAEVAQKIREARDIHGEWNIKVSRKIEKER